jgi:hypothetical protein
MAVKLLRTIRLDPSDTFVFERAAEPGEWAVPGTFMYWAMRPEELLGKARAAFRSGFLGLGSLGWSTLAVVTEAGEADRGEATGMLARHLRERFGAPSETAARAAAAEEIAFAASLCGHPPGTLVALHRSVDNDAIRERFRTLTPRAGRPKEVFRAFEFFETTDGAEAQGAAGEAVDLMALGKDGMA